MRIASGQWEKPPRQEQECGNHKAKWVGGNAETLYRKNYRSSALRSNSFSWRTNTNPKPTRKESLRSPDPRRHLNFLPSDQHQPLKPGLHLRIYTFRKIKKTKNFS